MVLKFNVIMVGTEKIFVFERKFLRLFILVRKQELGEFACNASRAANQSFMIFFEKFKVDSRLVPHSFGKSNRRKPAHVFVAGLVFAEQNQVKIASLSVAVLAFVRIRHGILFKMRTVSDIKFLTDNRIDSIHMAEMLKIERTEHISVVSERESGHIEPFRLRDKSVKRCTRVKQRIIRMNMKMNKITDWSTFWGTIEHMVVCHLRLPIAKYFYAFTMLRILSWSTALNARLSSSNSAHLSSGMR